MERFSIYLKIFFQISRKISRCLIKIHFRYLEIFLRYLKRIARYLEKISIYLGKNFKHRLNETEYAIYPQLNDEMVCHIPTVLFGQTNICLVSHSSNMLCTLTQGILVSNFAIHCNNLYLSN